MGADEYRGYLRAHWRQEPERFVELARRAAVHDVTLVGPEPFIRVLHAAVVAVGERHGWLARAARGADGFGLTERATALGGGLLRAVASDDSSESSGARTGLGGSIGRWPAARTRALVDDAREQLAYEAQLGLAELARRVGVSAFYLSRVLRRATGRTLSRYRAELRHRRALERPAGGERNLAGLAAELGYADQAHLTRSLRAATGATPGALRRMLGAGLGSGIGGAVAASDGLAGRDHAEAFAAGGAPEADVPTGGGDGGCTAGGEPVRAGQMDGVEAA